MGTYVYFAASLVGLLFVTIKKLEISNNLSVGIGNSTNRRRALPRDVDALVFWHKVQIIMIVVTVMFLVIAIGS